MRRVSLYAQIRAPGIKEVLELFTVDFNLQIGNCKGGSGRMSGTGKA